MKEIRRIIKEYKEACREWGVSEYQKEQLKKHAFDEIVAEVDRIDKAKEEQEAEIKALIEEERMLNENDDNIVYRGRGE